jgi:predicted nucleic acid-binding protein
LPDCVELRNVLSRGKSFPLWLGKGESEAILLAEEVSADMVLMDDYRGRRVALERGLRVGGTLSVLASGARLRLLDFETTVATLHGLGFRVSEQLVQEMAEELKF